MAKIAHAIKTDAVVKTIGQCSACLEMTSVEDPCCPMAGVLIDGEYVRPLAGFGDGDE